MLALTPSAIGPRLPDALLGVFPTLAVSVLSPVIILVLCVVAGVATVLLLPGKKDRAVGVIGGVILLAVGIILGALLVRFAAVAGGGPSIYFWLFAVIALGGAVRVVTHPRPVYSALYFVLTTFATAGLFVLLWAEFMAAALILIYAGAILVTYVFVIMLASQATSPGDRTAGDSPAPQGLDAVTEYDAVSREPVVAAAVGFAVMGLLLFVVFDKADGLYPPEKLRAEMFQVDSPQAGSTQQLGRYLFNNQVVNLELAGLILTISTVGAIVIARRRIYVAHPAGPAVPEVMVGPATPVDDNPYSIPVYGTDNPRQKAYPET